MAEIKSAIELAMERTKNLVMDEKEKKESQRRDAENKLKAILRRYLEGMIETDGVLEETGEIKADTALKDKVLMSLLLDELDITKENSRLLDLLKLLSRNLPGSILADLGAIMSAFAEEMKKKEMIVQGKVGERLRGIGVTGDGIEPNVEAWDEWTEAVEETGQTYKQQVEEWKGRLLEAMDKT